MLVFLSDVHLTDGSSGTTINPAAFAKFCRILRDVIGKDKERVNQKPIEKVEIVLLGDIFDIIRTNVWLRPQNNDPHNPIRPWSLETELDSGQWNLRQYTEAIVARITQRQENIDAMDHLHAFRRDCGNMGVQVEFTYLIGNHDWLINRYPSTREKIAGFLGMPDPQFYAHNRFPEYQVFEDYRVLARHGDRYDPFNYEKDRDNSSLGDAIVIDVLTRFPEEISRDPVLGGNPDLIAQLKELDNVRPVLDIPAWIQGVCNSFPEVEDKVHEIWNDLLDKFFNLVFIREHDRWGPDMVDFLQMALRLTSGLSFKKIQEILGQYVVRHFYKKADDYRSFAHNEAALRTNQVSYVVYGHTHWAEQIPLDRVPIPQDGVMEKVYFNSGTWRKVFEHTAFDADSFEFIGWHVMTFLVFYLEQEKEKDRNYEMWSASLGYGKG
jgi:UDP-2,3-diacylglucosamine pyrophosphatase LpxH